jgi:hypothetical protein
VSTVIPKGFVLITPALHAESHTSLIATSSEKNETATPSTYDEYEYD